MKTANEILNFIVKENILFEQHYGELDWELCGEQKLNDFLNSNAENQIEEETVTLTIGEIFNRADHPNDCGLDEWCVNEGRAEMTDFHTITRSQAKFMSDDEFAWRKN